ncbi:mucin-associated surface protein [Arthrobacter sp. FB24]|uniref:hypothetical protein n=1 Tax=Arthrobacter sp. (strain FB24) TaxID=290399 RepID=UPI0000527776|nr:hypothetical protein [Arthrobacter sp. FB24]ABK02747.1 mucin-associated surface protein [Arthrobacter sp. FB24]
MTTDRDILAALRGEHARDTAVAEASGRSPSAAARETGSAQRRGDAFESVAIWAAKEAAETATKGLAQAIMRADATKGIYAAESEATQIAAEAYTEAAKASPYEINRQESVARIVTKLAGIIGRKEEQTTKRPKPAAATGPKRPQQEAASRRAPVRVTEIGSGRITAVHK